MDLCWTLFQRQGCFSTGFAVESRRQSIPSVVGGRLHSKLMFLLTRPWTSQDRSSVIGRKWTCAVKWISAVSGLELCRIFPLRGAHWNSMGTLVIRPGARWRRSVTTRRFFHLFFFIWLETSLFSQNVFSLSTICSAERRQSYTLVYMSCSKKKDHAWWNPTKDKWVPPSSCSSNWRKSSDF